MSGQEIEHTVNPTDCSVRQSGMVNIRNKATGEVLQRHFIDAREAITSGEYEEVDTRIPPLLGERAAPFQQGGAQ